MMRGHIRYSHLSYLATFFCLALLIALPHPPDSKFDSKLSKVTLSSWTRMPECFPVPTSGNLFECTSKSPCKGSELKLYHDVTFGLVKVYMLSLVVHRTFILQSTRYAPDARPAAPAHLCMWKAWLWKEPFDLPL